MTTFHAVGKYAIGWSDAQKIEALEQTLEDAACELVRFGRTPDEVERALDNALAAAQEEAGLQ